MRIMILALLGQPISSPLIFRVIYFSILIDRMITYRFYIQKNKAAIVSIFSSKKTF